MGPEINPRYALYAEVNGREPQAQLAHDRQRFKGGTMTGFILWMRRAWQDFRRDRKYPDMGMSPAMHAEFDAWLTTHVRAGLSRALPCYCFPSPRYWPGATHDLGCPVADGLATCPHVVSDRGAPVVSCGAPGVEVLVMLPEYQPNLLSVNACDAHRPTYLAEGWRPLSPEQLTTEGAL